MEYNRKLILEDGQQYYGYGFGDMRDRVCEIVFNTSMVGYQEILSDPSYTYQAVVMTYPLIGNYGMADEDYETFVPTIGGLIVREYNDEPSNFRSSSTLSEVMKKYEIPGIYGVDTRKLTRSIRDLGSRKVLITDVGTSLEDGIKILRESSIPTDAVAKVSCKKVWESPAKVPVKTANMFNMEETPRNFEKQDTFDTNITENSYWRDDTKTSMSGKDFQKDGCSVVDLSVTSGNYHVVAIDCGMKLNIVRSLNQCGCDVTIVPWNTSAEDIESYKPDGIFLSNGPGNPEDVKPVIKTIKELRGKYPIFGICLGHQLISLAYGAKTYKLKFGHRGGNHPVRNLETGKIEITSQNHSYAVENESLLGTGLTPTHINLLDQTIEGVKCDKDRIFSVQYHPESAPGPQDSAYLFDRFIKLMEEEKKHA